MASIGYLLLLLDIEDIKQRELFLNIIINNNNTTQYFIYTLVGNNDDKCDNKV